MNLKDKKIVVIGGGGLIGSHTVDELLQEDVKEIIIYSNFKQGNYDSIEQALKDSRVQIFENRGDICQKDKLNEALKGTDGVFHLAALGLLECQKFPRAAFSVNVEGTFNVLEACVQQGVKRLVYSSSACVYGEALKEPMDEDHPLNNRNIYGATKIASEAMVRAYFHDYKLPFVGLRYMNVYGPRQAYTGPYMAVIMRMLDNINKGIGPTLYGDGSQAYDFVHVQDCAKANICAMKSGTVDQFYNVGTGVGTSIKDLAELILKITGSPLPLQYISDGVTFVKNRIGCPKKAAKEIGFRSSIGLEEGLKSLIEWRNAHVDQLQQRKMFA